MKLNQHVKYILLADICMVSHRACHWSDDNVLISLSVSLVCLNRLLHLHHYLSSWRRCSNSRRSSAWSSDCSTALKGCVLLLLTGFVLVVWSTSKTFLVPLVEAEMENTVKEMPIFGKPLDILKRCGSHCWLYKDVRALKILAVDLLPPIPHTIAFY